MTDERKKGAGDLGAGEVQKAVDKAEQQGFIGEKADPLPNSAHSLESGPDSPPSVEDDRTPASRPVAGGDGA